MNRRAVTAVFVKVSVAAYSVARHCTVISPAVEGVRSRTTRCQQTDRPKYRAEMAGLSDFTKTRVVT